MTPFSADEARALRDAGSVLVVATSDGRDYLFPSPASDQLIVNIETKSLERYASGAWTRLAVLDFAAVSAFTSLTADTLIVNGDPDPANTSHFKWSGTIAGDGDILPINASTRNVGTLTKPWSTVTGVNLLVTGAAGTNRYVNFYTGTSIRGQWGLSATAESGANAGSNPRLVLYDDSGASLGAALTVTRSTGVHAFTASPTVPTVTANDNSTKVATTAYVDRATTHTSSTTPAPTATTSATAVMMGLAGSITPTRGTKVVFMATGMIANDTLNDGATVDLRYGTGTAPTNGVAVTGTRVGGPKTKTSLVAGDRSGWTCVGKITGLTVGTPYWFDVSLLAITGGTASLTDVDLVAWEVP